MNSSAELPQTVIVGLGLTGLSCARYLLNRGESFRVVDSRSEPPGLEELKETAPAVTVEAGEFSEESFAGAERLLMSPGVDPRIPAIKKAVVNGVELSGDIDIFSREVQAPIVAVTGSNAKSTVVTLLGEMARVAGVDAVVAGNIGTPVLDLLQQPARALYVLELSSFQLETTEKLNAEVSTILNISSDHMDRYDSMEDYISAKHRIFNGSHQVVVNRNDPLCQPGEEFAGKTLTWALDVPEEGQYGLRVMNDLEWLARGEDCLLPTLELKIAGRHNISNALAALALGEAAGLPVYAMVEALRSFSGLPHRCQWVATVNGVEYYNDSKGTNPGACLAAIEGLASRGQIILLLGGQGKGADFSLLRDAVEMHVKQVVVFGEDANRIENALGNVAFVRRASAFDQAVKMAAEAADEGDLVLLSPACASFDMFRNYQHRGDTFAELVREMPA